PPRLWHLRPRGGFYACLNGTQGGGISLLLLANRTKMFHVKHLAIITLTKVTPNVEMHGA
ncbi:MAG: hypothetical protein M3178_12345, partial [Pseudomonadota bacterium]|nr:hypothetical protein [Pseudomonadota bacterium]